MTDHDPAATKKAALDAAIRNHYGDPNGRHILAFRGIPFPEDADNDEGR